MKKILKVFDGLSDKQLERVFMVSTLLAVFTFGMLIGSRL